MQKKFVNWPEQNKRQRPWASIEDAAKVIYRDDYLSLFWQFEALKLWNVEAEKPHKAELQ